MEFNVKLLTQKNVVISSLLVENYTALKLNDREFVLIIHIINFQMSGVEFPTFEQISGRMSITENECMTMFMGLLSKGYVQIDNYTNEYDVICERYNFTPLYTMLAFHLDKAEKAVKNHVQEQKNENLYLIFEQEFGRPLSPIEIEILRQWIEVDHYTLEMIKSALKEAVIAQALSFKYLERILFDWSKNGITTSSEARLEGEKFRVQKQHTKNSSEATKMTFVDWAK